MDFTLPWGNKVFWPFLFLKLRLIILKMSLNCKFACPLTSDLPQKLWPVSNKRVVVESQNQIWQSKWPKYSYKTEPSSFHFPWLLWRIETGWKKLWIRWYLSNGRVPAEINVRVSTQLSHRFHVTFLFTLSSKQCHLIFFSIFYYANFVP